MAYSLRLPEDLDARARERAQAIGISLNALVCVALDAYLRSGISLPEVGSKPMEWEPKAVARDELVEKLQHVRSIARPVPDNDPKPVLPANPSKADRTRLAQWYERHPGGK